MPIALAAGLSKGEVERVDLSTARPMVIDTEVEKIGVKDMEIIELQLSHDTRRDKVQSLELNGVANGESMLSSADNKVISPMGYAWFDDLVWADRPIVSSSTNANVRSCYTDLSAIPVPAAGNPGSSAVSIMLWWMSPNGRWEQDSTYGDNWCEFALVPWANTSSVIGGYSLGGLDFGTYTNNGMQVYAITNGIIPIGKLIDSSGNLGPNTTIPNGVYRLVHWADGWYTYNTGVVVTDGIGANAVQITFADIDIDMDSSVTTATATGRVYSPALAAAYNAGIPWCETWTALSVVDSSHPGGRRCDIDIYDVDQSLNALAVQGTNDIYATVNFSTGVATHNNVWITPTTATPYPNSQWICDANGYFSITIPVTQAQKLSGYVMPWRPEGTSTSVVGVEGYYFNCRTLPTASNPNHYMVGANKSTALNPKYIPWWRITSSVTANTGGTISPVSPLGGITLVKGGEPFATPFVMTPNTGYKISAVKIDGTPVSLTGTPGLTINPMTGVGQYVFQGNIVAARTIEVTYEIQQLKIDSSVAGPTGCGTITPLGETLVNYNGSQSYTIAANTGYTLVDVKVDDESQGPITSYTFNNVIIDHDIVAYFEEDAPPEQYIITPSVNGGVGGTISPSTPQTVNAGATPTFTFAPAAGYELWKVEVDGVAVTPLPTTSYTFEPVVASHTIVAFYRLEESGGDELHFYFINAGVQSVQITKKLDLQSGLVGMPGNITWAEAASMGYTVVWESMNTTLATVTQQGIVTGKKQGMLIIKATISGPEGSTFSQVINFSVKVY